MTFVLADPATAGRLRASLEEHGVDHAAVVAQIRSIRRSLVLGENRFVVVCIALDRPTLQRQGEAIRSLLSDHRCFPTTVRTVGLLTDLGLTREAAELGCDVYVDDSAKAAEAIRLLDDAWAAECDAPAPAVKRRLQIHGGWKFGSPRLPTELASLVAAESDCPGHAFDPLSPHSSESSRGEFGDPTGPQ